MAGETILVVDDSPTERALMLNALEGNGYRLLSAEDAVQALDKVNASPPDLIVLDVILPGMNGYQLCRQIKASARTSRVRVVLCSGKSQESDRHWGLRQGADEYVTKPFEAAELLNVVRRQLRRP